MAIVSNELSNRLVAGLAEQTPPWLQSAQASPGGLAEAIGALEMKDFHRAVIDAAIAHPKVVVMLPRGTGKTTLLSGFLPAWLLGHNRNLRLGLASHSLELAKLNLEYISQVMQHERYTYAFGRIVPGRGQSTWNDISKFVVGRDLIRHKDPNLYALGYDGSTLGHRLDWLLCDDLCFDDQTEILTENGFKLFEALAPSEKVATLSPAGFLEYQEPSRYITKPYIGEMFTYKSKHINFSVTPGHNMYVSRYRGPKMKWQEYQLEPIEQIYGLRAAIRFKKGCDWSGPGPEVWTIPAYQTLAKRQVPIEPFLVFLGFWIAEGRLAYNRVTITQKIDSIHTTSLLGAIKQMGYTPKVYPQHDRERMAITIYDPPLSAYLSRFQSQLQSRSQPPSQSPTPTLTLIQSEEYKHLIPEVKGLSSNLLGIFLHWYLNGYEGGADYYTAKEDIQQTCTTSRQLSDDLIEVALKSGLYASAVASADAQQLDITFSKNQLHSAVTCFGRERWQKIQYAGNVYCVTVPNGLIYVRNNGASFWAGNCEMKNSRTSQMRARLEQWFFQEVMPLVEPPELGGHVVVFGTCIAPDDLYAALEDLGWYIVRVPIRDSAGKSIWPERYSDEYLAALEKERGRYFATQYLLKPATASSLEFNPLSLPICNVVLELEKREDQTERGDEDVEQENKAAVLQTISVGVDPAISLLDRADNFALVVSGTIPCTHNNQHPDDIVILDCRCGHFTLEQQEELIKERSREWRAGVVNIENVAAQDYLIQRLVGHVPVRKSPTKLDHATRFDILADVLHSGRICWRAGDNGDVHAAVLPLFQELDNYPSRYDDLISALDKSIEPLIASTAPAAMVTVDPTIQALNPSIQQRTQLVRRWFRQGLR